MPTYKLTVAYDGTDFFGWQFQPGKRTVQQTLNEALSQITSAAVVVTASGRTDAGVHALGQVVGFSTDSALAPEVLLRAMNAELPNDIAVLAIEPAPLGFDPIRHAKRKRYRYVLEDGPVLNVFALRYAWHSYRRLDADAMHRAARTLVGTHDFTSFETSGSTRVTTIRTVYELSVRRTSIALGGEAFSAPGVPATNAAEQVHLEIEADGFLYNMVRNIVGTLVEVGRGAKDERWPGEVLASLDRKAAGCAAPPQGLFLVSVSYEKSRESGDAGQSRESGVGSRE